MHYDPVCGRRMNPNRAYVKLTYKGETYYLCCPECQARFEEKPENYVKRDSHRKR